MLCEIGNHYLGFETDIHGLYRKADNRYTAKVIKKIICNIRQVCCEEVILAISLSSLM